VKLILLSPVGIDGPLVLSPDATANTGIPPTTSVKRPSKFSDGLLGYLWARYHITPLAIIRLTGPLMPLAITAFVHSSNLYDWIGEDKELRRLVRKYTYALVRHRSSAEALMPCFISKFIS
jgi:hypothetical protein